MLQIYTKGIFLHFEKNVFDSLSASPTVHQLIANIVCQMNVSSSLCLKVLLVCEILLSVVPLNHSVF